MQTNFPASIEDLRPPREEASAKAIEQLGQSYRKELPSKLATMERLVPEAAAGSRAALEEIVLQAHRLGGTARMFDLSALSDAMSDVEESLARLSTDHRDFRDSSAWLRVDKAICLAKSLIDTNDDPANGEG